MPSSSQCRLALWGVKVGQARAINAGMQAAPGSGLLPPLGCHAQPLTTHSTPSVLAGMRPLPSHPLSGVSRGAGEHPAPLSVCERQQRWLSGAAETSASLPPFSSRASPLYSSSLLSLNSVKLGLPVRFQCRQLDYALGLGLGDTTTCWEASESWCDARQRVGSGMQSRTPSETHPAQAEFTPPCPPTPSQAS